MRFTLALVLGAMTIAATEVKLAREQCFEAVRNGDRAALERLIAPDFTFVHSTGVVENRQQFIDRSVSSPSRDHLEFLDESIRTYGGSTAICVSRSVTQRGTPAETNLRGTDVFVKIDGVWKLAAVHSTKLATRPKAITISPESLDRFTGRYAVGPDRVLVVSRHDGALTGTLRGIRQTEMIPVAPAEFVWFSPESNVDMRLTFGDKDVTLKADGVERWRAEKLVQ